MSTLYRKGTSMCRFRRVADHIRRRQNEAPSYRAVVLSILDRSVDPLTLSSEKLFFNT